MGSFFFVPPVGWFQRVDPNFEADELARYAAKIRGFVVGRVFGGSVGGGFLTEGLAFRV